MALAFLSLGRGGELRSMTHCGGGGELAGVFLDMFADC